MTLFDLIAIAVVLISAVLAMFRGFTNEVLSILAWVVGAVAALWLFPYVAPMVATAISPYWLAAAISAVGIFIVGYAICAALTARWSGSLMDLYDRASLLDKTLGFLFGAARGLLIVTVAYLFFAWLVPNPADQPAWIRDARLRPTVEASAALLFSLASTPANTTWTEPERRTAPLAPYVAPSRETPPPAQPQPQPEPRNSGADTGNGPGYNPSERRGLDRLFENTTGE